MLKSVNPNSTFVSRFKSLLAQYPNVDVAAMGFNLTMDTLAFGYVIPAIRAYSGLAPVRQCSCRAYLKKSVIPLSITLFQYFWLRIAT